MLSLTLDGDWHPKLPKGGQRHNYALKETAYFFLLPSHCRHLQPPPVDSTMELGLHGLDTGGQACFPCRSGLPSSLWTPAPFTTQRLPICNWWLCLALFLHFPSSGSCEMDSITSLFFFSSTAIKCHRASLRSDPKLAKETKGTGREPQFPQNQQDPFISKVYLNHLLCTQIERRITVTVAHDSEIQRQRQQHSERTLVTPVAYTVDSVSHRFQPQRLKLDSNRTDVRPLSIGTEQWVAELIEKEPDSSLSNELLINFLPLYLFIKNVSFICVWIHFVLKITGIICQSRRDF